LDLFISVVEWIVWQNGVVILGGSSKLLIVDKCMLAQGLGLPRFFIFFL
jgi:hypothetical protein